MVFSADFLSGCWCFSWIPWPVCLPPGFLCFFVDVALEFVNSAQQSHVFFLYILSPSQDKMHCTLSLTVCTCTPCQRASFNSTTDFFRGVMTLHSCLQGQTVIQQMWDFSECVVANCTGPVHSLCSQWTYPSSAARQLEKAHSKLEQQLYRSSRVPLVAVNDTRFCSGRRLV